jgi:hypothetical protein
MIDLSKIDKTRTGRVLTLVNLALTLTFAFWAVGVYSNHVDLSDKSDPQKSAEDQSIYLRRAETVKKLDQSRGPAEARLQSTRNAVARAEELRPALQSWYAAELESLRTGNQPPQAPSYVKDEIQLDKQGYPRMGPVLGPDDRPLRGLDSLAKLSQIYKQKLEEIQSVTSAIDERIAEQQKSSTEIGNGQEQGLRRELANVQGKIGQSRERQENLKPKVYNRQVELALLLKRQQGLESRLKELER